MGTTAAGCPHNAAVLCRFLWQWHGSAAGEQLLGRPASSGTGTQGLEHVSSCRGPAKPAQPSSMTYLGGFVLPHLYTACSCLLHGDW